MVLRIIISAIGISAVVYSLGEDVFMDSLFLLCGVCGFWVFIFADIAPVLCISTVSGVVIVASMF
jgi:hypothetical protein